MEKDYDSLIQYLYDRALPIVQSLEPEADAYAISFFVYANGAYLYRGYENIVSFEIGTVTDRSVDFAEPQTEDYWIFCYPDNEQAILKPANQSDAHPELHHCDGLDFLFSWYAENNVTNLGNYSLCTDPQGNKVQFETGFPEVLYAVSQVARRLQQEGIVKRQFGRTLPIRIHGRGDDICYREATRVANPNGEADAFFQYLVMQDMEQEQTSFELTKSLENVTVTLDDVMKIIEDFEANRTSTKASSTVFLTQKVNLYARMIQALEEKQRTEALSDAEILKLESCKERVIIFQEFIDKHD